MTVPSVPYRGNLTQGTGRTGWAFSVMSLAHWLSREAESQPIQTPSRKNRGAVGVQAALSREAATLGRFQCERQGKEGNDQTSLGHEMAFHGTLISPQASGQCGKQPTSALPDQSPVPALPGGTGSATLWLHCC